MSEDALTRTILKFLRQMNAEDSEESAVRHAVERNWLDDQGAPTADGRRLALSFDLLRSIDRNLS
jgi:hypothetical protein